MPTMRFTAFALCAGLATGCASTTKVESSLDTSMQAYSTFTIDHDGISPPDGFRAGNLDAFPLVCSSIATELKNKGYAEAPAAEADWLVEVREGIKSEEKTVTAPASPSRADLSTAPVSEETAETTNVRLIVGLRARADDKVVWKCTYDGPARKFVGPLSRKVRKAVERCLADLPKRG